MKKFFKAHVKLCIAVLALSLVTVGATLALMVSQSNSVTNQFTAAEIDTEIKEELNGEMTKQVSITNQGRSDAYVRARIMVSGINTASLGIAGSEEQANQMIAENQCSVCLVMPNLDPDGVESGKWYPGDPTNDETWKNGSGFYYYLGVLPGTDKETDEAERETPALLAKVVLSKDLKENTEFLEKFSVAIYHESVLAIDQSELITSVKVENAFTTAAGTTTNP